MKVKVKNFSDKEGLMPKKAYPNDFCYDLYAVSEEQIAPNVWKYGLGWGMQIERGDTPTILGKFVAQDVGSGKTKHLIACGVVDLKPSKMNLSIDIRPRSSIWKTGMMLSNSVGTVDENYINEISAVFYHVMPDLPRYRVGDRVAQCKIGFTIPIEFEEVEELNETDRGLNGYGSSGLK